MKSKDLKYLIVISVLLIAIFWLWWTEPDPVSTRNEVTKENKGLEESNATLQEEKKVLREKYVADSLRGIETARAYRQRISSLENKLRKNTFKQASAPELDSIRMALYPMTSDTIYCAPITAIRLAFEDGVARSIQDSIIVEQAARIEVVEGEKQAAIDNLTKSWGNTEKQYYQQQAISLNLGKALDKSEAARKREKKGGWVKAGISAVAAFFIGRGT